MTIPHRVLTLEDNNGDERKLVVKIPEDQARYYNDLQTAYEDCEYGTVTADVEATAEDIENAGQIWTPFELEDELELGRDY
jgi:hypothetical protein